LFLQKNTEILRGQGKTILLTSHVFELLMHVCDTVHLLEKGTITNSVEKPQFDDFYVTLKAKIDKNQDSILERLF
jgi:ABC-2 type transport system ATP-binding protein